MYHQTLNHFEKIEDETENKNALEVKLSDDTQKNEELVVVERNGVE